VRTMAAKAHNPGAITKKVFFDMEIGGNKAGAWTAVPESHSQHCRAACVSASVSLCWPV
jgi:hypothetical protein